MFRCRQCGAHEAKWAGHCRTCDEWGSFDEVVEQAAESRSPTVPAVEPARPIASVSAAGSSAVPTGVLELDLVLQGGLVPGSVTLLGGEPGIGKSTLVLQALAGRAGAGDRCLYLTAEESTAQVRRRADRLGALADDLWLASVNGLGEVEAQLAEVEPALVALDSVQAVGDPVAGANAGTLAQVREVTQRLTALAKSTGTSVVLVGHVTKDGALAGPKVLEHLVDTVLSFAGERHHALRVLRAVKHRFGSVDGVGLFEMTGAGLDAVADASSLFLADRRPGTSGSVVAPLVEGQRPLLVEVQALVARSPLNVPRRSSPGLDAGRLALVLAVLERRLGLSMVGSDVHVAVAGGVRAVEPATDLALALALVSAVSGIAVPDDVAVCGELGLGGEVRQVHQMPRRLAEAARLGFRRALVPASAPVPGVAGPDCIRVDSLAEAASQLGLLRDATTRMPHQTLAGASGPDRSVEVLK